MSNVSPRIEVCDGEQMARIIDEMWDDRVSFAKYIIGFNPSDQQGDALASLDKYDSVSVKSGHGCHSPETLIMMYDGSVKRADCVVVGDKLMGPNSMPRIVKELFSGTAPMYRVKSSDNTFYDVNGLHTLCLVATQTHGRQTFGDYTETTVEEFLLWSDRKRRTNAGYKVPVLFPHAELPIPPYILGLWLGDGHSRSTGLTNIDPEVTKEWCKYGESVGLRVRIEGDSLHLVGDERSKTYPSRRVNGFKQNLADLDLICNKYIPDLYLRASFNQRQELLAGLIDTDGNIEGEGTRLSITQKNEQLAIQILWLAQSIGCHATLRKVQKTCCNNGAIGTYYTVGITRNIELIPVRIARKIPAHGRTKQRSNLHFGIKIEPIGKGQYFGFKVGGDNLYLLADFTVTHNCGKSGVESVTVLHYMSCRTFPKIPCTSPSKHQLYDVLWAELSKWHRQMNPLFRDMFVWTKEKFMHKEHPEEWFAVARTATKENPEALAGFHADYILRIIDEASGVCEPVFEVLEGAHGRLETKELMCGNPTRLEGTFYRSHTKDKDSYKGITWSCLDSPWVKQQYIDRIFRKFGKDSNIARVRVYGLFPLQEGDSFIPYALVEDAMFRDIVPQDTMPVVFGVDVARFGDDETVIAIRRGDEFLPYHVLRGKDTVQIASYVRALANVHKPTAIFVDVIGWGAGVHDNLYHAGFPSYGINVSESPAMEPDTYRRLRDELWGGMRDWLQERRGRLCNKYCESLKGTAIEDTEDTLIGELTTPKYEIPHGKIVIESKDKLKARQVQSPNRADAHNLTFAQPMASYQVDESPEGNEDYQNQALDPEAGY